MKLNARDAAAFLARPDRGKAGLLIYGADPVRVDEKRRQAVRAYAGETGEAEMRVTRLPGPEVRRDPAALHDAVKAQGFFAGDRVVVVEEAGDGVTAAVAAALDDWREGDAHLVVQAGALARSSKLRTLFEKSPAAAALAVYDDPPGRAEIEAALAAAGLTGLSRDALLALGDLARKLDPGDFRQTLEKIALYKLGDTEPLTPEEVAQLAPATVEAAVDDVIRLAAEGEAERIGPILRRLEGQGLGAVSIVIGATRHFRTLHAVASHPGGPGAGVAKLRPPLFGPARERVERQAQRLGRDRIEKALSLLLDTDLALRSAAPVPEMASVERALLRIAWTARR